MYIVHKHIEYKYTYIIYIYILNLLLKVNLRVSKHAVYNL